VGVFRLFVLNTKWWFVITDWWDCHEDTLNNQNTLNQSSPSARRIWWNPPLTVRMSPMFSRASFSPSIVFSRRKHVWEWQSRLTTWWTPIHTWLTAPKIFDTPCGLLPFFRVCQLTSTIEQVHRQLVKWQKTIKVVHSFVSSSSFPIRRSCLKIISFTQLSNLSFCLQLITTH